MAFTGISDMVREVRKGGWRCGGAQRGAVCVLTSLTVSIGIFTIFKPEVGNWSKETHRKLRAISSSKFTWYDVYGDFSSWRLMFESSRSHTHPQKYTGAI